MSGWGRELNEGNLLGRLDGKELAERRISWIELEQLLSSRRAQLVRNAEIAKRGLTLTVEDLIMATLSDVLAPPTPPRGSGAPQDVLAYIDGVEEELGGAGRALLPGLPTRRPGYRLAPRWPPGGVS